jgi:murein DD-endopeptidase MepM/ murein hydrolase activator NlpD
MALPILAKGITSALVKKGKSAKKDDKVSVQKLLSNSTTSQVKSKVKFSKVEPRKLVPYRKKVETTKFLPPSKVDEKFSINKLEALLTSLVGSTANLQKITKKDLGDVKKSNRTKENIKQKSKRQRNEEKTESKKTVAKVSRPMKLTVPSLFKDIFKIGGRLILSLGIMELLKFLDPEKKESIFGFLMEHLDKIVLGALGILGITFVASFLPVIGMVGSILSILTPIIIGIGSFLLNPVILGPILAALALIAVTAGTAAPGTLDESALDQKLTPEARIVTIESIYGGLPLNKWPPQVLLQYEEDLRSEGLMWKDVMPRLLENQKKFTQQQQDIIDEQSKPQTPQAQLQTPQAQPQTPIVGDTKLGGASGDSGSAMYKGRGKKAALSTGITPFLQSDIDKQGISIISGFGKRFGRDHKGYDLPAAEGTPLHAYLPGVVVRNMPNVSGYGNLVEWKDDVYGQTHMFAHMMEPSELRSGTKFKAGTVLGKVGNTDGGTGISEGPHLHWEIGPQGSEVDPGEWLKSHPINIAPKQPSNKAEEVSSTASYEETGLQVAMIQVPLPVPMPLPGGGGGVSSGGSRSFGGTDIDSIILGQSFSNA